MSSAAGAAELTALLDRCGLVRTEVDVRPCRRGGNNQVDVVEAGGRRLALKRYYRGSEDTHDRLASEWQFLVHCERLRIDCVPRPIACDPPAGVALYEFIDGEKPAAGEVGPSEVAAASAFFVAINTGRAASGDLPIAAEACFSLADHLALVERRIAKLATITPVPGVDAEAALFVRRLAAEWQRIRTLAVARAGVLGWDMDRIYAADERCISPSDFGFHNAIIRPTGDLCFIDFEYAGWDDPAKMAADFFCQPAIPVPPGLLDGFLHDTMAVALVPERAMARARILLPVYRVKWCCIMLNDFVPEFARRRIFADPGADVEKRKLAQLRKAEAALAGLLERVD